MSIQVLHGWRDIAAAFRVKQSTAKQWAQEGAPLLFLEDAAPIVEAGELWDWLKATYGQEQTVQSKDEAKAPALLTWGSVAEIKRAMREEGAEPFPLPRERGLMPL